MLFYVWTLGTNLTLFIKNRLKYEFRVQVKLCGALHLRILIFPNPNILLSELLVQESYRGICV